MPDRLFNLVGASTVKQPVGRRTRLRFPTGARVKAIVVATTGKKGLQQAARRFAKRTYDAHSEFGNSTTLGEFAFIGAVLKQSAATVEASVSHLDRDHMITLLPDQLVLAHFYPKLATLALEFADGQDFSLPVERLGMPVDRIDWPTAEASPGGESMMVMGIKGDPVPIDSATLRYLVDLSYAAEVDAKLESLQFTGEELDRIVRDNPAPLEWYLQSSQNMTRESWK